MSGEKLKEVLKQVDSTEGLSHENILYRIKERLEEEHKHMYVGWKISTSGAFNINHLFLFQNEHAQELKKGGYEGDGEDNLGLFSLYEGIEEREVSHFSPYQSEYISEVARDALSVDFGFSGRDEDELDTDLTSALQNKHISDEYSLLHMVASCGLLRSVDALLRAGAEPNILDNNGSTALHSAVANGYIEVVKILLASGAEVNAADVKGYTPLHYAAQHGHQNIMQILLEKGANTLLENINGVTPMSLTKDAKTRGFLKNAKNKIKDKKIGTTNGDICLTDVELENLSNKQR